MNKLFLRNHTGTHIDFPSHVIKNGKTSSDFPIENLIGSGIIIEEVVLIWGKGQYE